MEEVRMLVRFGGTWDTSADGRYAYNGGRLRGMKVAKGIAYKGFVELLYRTIEVDANEYVLKMEVLWHSSSMPLPPMEICNDSDLCFFLDGGCGSANDFIPLCVTLVHKDSTLTVARSPVHQVSNCHTHSVSGSESNQIDSTKPSPNEPELETIPPYVPVVTFKEQLPMSHPQMSPPPLSQQPTLVNNDTQGNTHHVDGPPNTAGAYAVWNEEGVFEGVERGNQVKDNAPANNVKDSRKNVCARPSRKFSYLPYLPECDATKLTDADDDAFVVGQTFASKKELRKSLNLDAIKKHYQFKISRSTTKRFEAICINKDCKWRVFAIKSKENDNFKLRRLHLYHSCATDQVSGGHRQATSRLVGYHVKEQLLDKQCEYKPREIMEDMRNRYGIELSYNKCWRARDCAIKEIKGSLENSDELFASAEKVVRKRAPSGIVRKRHDPSSIVPKKCGQCGVYGHNRQTCRNPTPLQPSSEGKT
ncbi:hypothetical protein Patl1_07692 [Pistacia atlantica]|uniref:Uncharacterized protein n=1 Tax=Pistacia atlantica TaxID=434234 RepID=A0ACC1ALH5_9ROSI|nr:hypothetical protein Patl1_07692 [Pistacia atlantica]